MSKANPALVTVKAQRLDSLTVLSLLAGVLGWWASLQLFQSFVGSLKDSNFIPDCNLSAVVSCSQNYQSSYGSLFGFSNTVLGLTLFVLPVVVGVLRVTRVSLPRWFYGGYAIGLLLATVFISYLQWASFTQLRTLCLYCFLIWLLVIPLFWRALATAVSGYSSKSAVVSAVTDNAKTVSREGLEDSAVRQPATRGFLEANWWLFALLHAVLVIVFGEVTVQAITSLFSAIFG